MKYIIFKNSSGESFSVLFPDIIDHKKMSEFITNEFKTLAPNSAGFLKVYSDEINCSGNSSTLDIRSKPEDKDIIKRTLK